MSDYRTTAAKRSCCIFTARTILWAVQPRHAHITELLPEFAGAGAEVIGVSKDSWESHSRFAEKKGLRFTLLSDPQREVLELYDVLKDKKNGGKVVRSAVRSSYLIDENGVITGAYGNVKAAENAADMLAALQN